MTLKKWKSQLSRDFKNRQKKGRVIRLDCNHGTNPFKMLKHIKSLQTNF